MLYSGPACAALWPVLPLMLPCSVQDYFFAVPSQRHVADHEPHMSTWCGRVIQFFSADIEEPSGETCTRDLALVEWLCSVERPPEDELTPIEVWTGERLCYEPRKPWTDVINVNRILGPEPVVPYSRWPTIPARFWKAPTKASEWATPDPRFLHGNADKPGKPGSGSKMYIRQAMLRKLGRLHPQAPDKEDEQDGGMQSDGGRGSSSDSEEYSSDSAGEGAVSDEDQ